jgi:hypothetical protein
MEEGKDRVRDREKEGGRSRKRIYSGFGKTYLVAEWRICWR